MVILSTEQCGQTLFITCKNADTTISRYALAWSTAEADGIPGVLAYLQSQGEQPTAQPAAWVQQLIGQVVNV